VRERVGIVDVSSLGKIDVQGPDVAEFLNRVYVNNWDTLKVGKARYGVMLRPDGVVLDDGTTSRISETHYFMTTTTAAAAKVMTYLEFLLQTAWPNLRVHLTSVTSQWAAMAVAGPRSRDVLSSVIAGVDFGNASFPFMGVDQGHINDIPVRLNRLSFSGEMAYEIYAPAGYGEQVWKAIYDTGQSYGIVPYGSEALNILRIEKGHVAGPELDGRTTLADLGMSRMASKKKSFIGSTLMQREGMVDTNRPQLVGLEYAGDQEEIRAGAILCEQDQHEGHGIGFVTSVAYSPKLDKNIGLGFVSGGLSRQGDTIDAVFPLREEVASVRIVSPHFVDPEGARLNA
jgi:sarcosine oxidase subunit alpha